MKRTWIILAALAACQSVAAAETERPNVLFAFADDWGRYASIYAQKEGPGSPNDVLKTPNFDRLAREGVLFRHAFVSAPSCTPCRSALLSGQHFWRTGRAAILSGAVWDPSIPTYPLLMEKSGYHLGETFKVWSPGTPADAPYGAPRNSYQKKGGRFNGFSQVVTKLVASGKSLEDARQELYDEVSANFDDFLADRKPDQPFCYWFGPTNVHRKWVRGSGQALWKINPDDLKGKMPAFLPDVPLVRQDLADYFGEVQAFDAALGVLLKKLEAIGELDSTLIVVSGDHGPPGFPRGKCNLYDFGTEVPLVVSGPGVKGGRVVDDLVSLTDLAPTFLDVANVPIPDTMTGKSLKNVLQSEKSGHVDPTRTEIFTGRERHVDSAREGSLPYPQRAIRTPDYLFILNFHPERWPMGDPFQLDGPNPPSRETLTENTRVTFQDMDAGPTKAWLIEHRDDPKYQRFYELAFARRPAEELYILADDPDEIHNRAADPRYAREKERLKQRLLHVLKETGDPRVIDNGRFFETPPMAGPIQRARPTNR